MTMSARGAVTLDVQYTQTRHTGVGLDGRTLHTLAHSQWSRTRMLVAMCDETMAETIHMLVSDPNPLVRAYAIAHGNATREQVNKGMSDADAQVVKQAARKCDDPQLLSISATHKSREVSVPGTAQPHGRALPVSSPHPLEWWRWRESNPRPTVAVLFFSERSPRKRFSPLAAARTNRQMGTVN